MMKLMNQNGDKYNNLLINFIHYIFCFVFVYKKFKRNKILFSILFIIIIITTIIYLVYLYLISKSIRNI